MNNRNAALNVPKELGYNEYAADVDAIVKRFHEGSSKDELLNKLIHCFEKYTHPEFRSHFLYMTSEVFDEMGQEEAAYEICLKTEKLFPETRFGRVAADVSKAKFTKVNGRLKPPPPFAPTIQIEPTNRCNIDCIMCDRDKGRPAGDMPLETFSRVIDQALNAGAYGIRLYHMGEPLLNRNIVDFIRYFINRKNALSIQPPQYAREIGLQTNGLLLTEDKAFNLMESGLSDLAFSIDGRSPQEFERIRRGARFEKVIRNLTTARRIRDDHGFATHLYVSVVDMEMSREDKIRLTRTYQNHGADQVFFNPCNLNEGRHVVNAMGEIVPAKGPAENPMHQNQGGTEDLPQPSTTGMLDRLVVLWNGDIVPSCGEPSKNSIIGNIADLSLTQAYQIKMEILASL